MMCLPSRVFIIATCCILAAVSAMAQVHLADSLLKVLDQHPARDTTRVNILIDLSLKEFRHQPALCKQHGQQALELSQQLGYEKGIGYAYDALSRQAYISGEYQSSVDYGFKMLSIFETLKLKKGIATACSDIGASYSAMRDFTKGALYLRKAIALNIETGNQAEWLYTYNRYGLLLYNSGKFDSALIVHKRILSIREKLNDANGIAQSCNNIGIVLVDTKRLREAAPFFKRSLAYFEGQQDTLRMGGVCQNLGNLYLQQKDFSAAEKYLTRALIMAKAFGSHSELQSAYGFMADLEEAHGNYRKALTYQREAHVLQNKIYNEDKANILAEAETRYKTEKIEQTIKLLEKEKQIQTIGQYLLLVGVLLIGAIYVLQRSRTRRIRDLLASQEILNAKLKETDLMKSRFFANISHEFRTPLSLIIAPVEEQLHSRDLNAHDKAGLTLAVRNANRLLVLINQLLDLSKMEARRAELDITAGNLKKFLSVLAASFESLACSKNIHFIQMDTIPDGIVNFDADKLEKVVVNILFNAFKFTPAEGTVTLNVSAPDRMTLMIKVSDTGKGIPIEDQPYIFSPFYQSKHTRDDGQPGTGLGLALAAEMLKAYNGTIELQSIVHEGTTITITIPVDWTEEIVENQQHVYSRDSAQFIAGTDDTTDKLYALSGDDDDKGLLLVIEDNRDLRDFITSVFDNHFTVITAADGGAGLAAAIDRIPDLIISDVMMPVMDGLTLVDKIKSDERTSHIPIVLLTAKANIESRLQGLRNGADDYLSKPFSVDELRIRVDNLIALRRNLMTKFRAQLETSPAEITESLDERFIQKAKSIIDEHISDTEFGVDFFASEMFMSRSQLFRKFKALLDISPSEYINDIRLAKAEKLIAARADTVSQISYAVGFKDQSYFAKRFRKKYGKSPSEYAGSA